MEKERQVVCFQHCELGSLVTCFVVPPLCPICGDQVAGSALKVPPFTLPSPFVHSRSSPYCIVIRPTDGSFLTDYTKTSDLHVGLTDTYGGVYHFDVNGVHYDVAGWSQCLAVLVITAGANNIDDDHVSDVWDTLLMQFSTAYCQAELPYSEVSNNCFDFALQFLQLFLRNFSSAEVHNDNRTLTWSTVFSKETFCSTLILPQTRRAARYIYLYRRLLSEQFVIDMNDRSTHAEEAEEKFINTESYTTHL